MVPSPDCLSHHFSILWLFTLTCAEIVLILAPLHPRVFADHLPAVFRPFDDDLVGRERAAGTDPAARVSADTFVSAMIASDRVNASPDELAAAYTYASGRTGDGDRSLTLEQLAAFAADGAPADAPQEGGSGGFGGWASWVGVGHGDGGAAARRAVVKARIKFRDAGLLGRPFPGEAFARLDPEGGGRVSRLVFKRALREIGFALVDEAPEGQRLEAPGDELRKPQGESSEQANVPACGEGWREQQSKAIGDDILGSITDDAAREDVEIQPCGGDDQEEGEDARRRRVFREKVEEIERATAEKVRHVDGIRYSALGEPRRQQRCDVATMDALRRGHSLSEPVTVAPFTAPH